MIKQRGSSFGGAVMIIALIIGAIWIYSDREQVLDFFGFSDEQNFRGLVVSNNNQCSYDDYCVLQLALAGSRQIYVYYRGADMELITAEVCRNPQVPEIAKSLTVGDPVAVFGQRLEGNNELKLEVCSNPKFYVKLVK